MRKQHTKKHKPKTIAGRSASRDADGLQLADDPSWQERFAWLSLPRLHTAIFEDIVKMEGVAEIPQLKFSSTEAKRSFNRNRRKQRIQRKEITNKFGWTARRFDKFKMLAVAYRKEPSIEHYLAIRVEFPELDIQIGHSGGIESLFALEDKFRQYGIDPWFVAGAMDGFEPDVDKLCLALMERIVARDKIRGPGQIQRRRATISDAMVNFLIAVMLEGFDWHGEALRIPASLILLIRHQLGPLRGDLHEEYRSREARNRAAWRAGEQLKPNEKLSINRLIKLASGPDNPISRATAARWLKDEYFKRLLEDFRKPRLSRPKK